MIATPAELIVIGCEEALAYEASAIGTSARRVLENRSCRHRSTVAVRHALVRRLFDRGYIIADISRAIGLHHTTIHNILKHSKSKPPLFGEAPPRLGPTPYLMRSKRVARARAELAAAFRAEGLSWTEVAVASGYATHVSAMEAVRRITNGPTRIPQETPCSL